jgi:hypothetical protein
MQGQRSGAVVLCIRQSMIRKSGNRFSEKIMLHQNARAKSLQSEAISL